MYVFAPPWRKMTERMSSLYKYGPREVRCVTVTFGPVFSDPMTDGDDYLFSVLTTLGVRPPTLSNQNVSSDNHPPLLLSRPSIV